MVWNLFKRLDKLWIFLLWGRPRGNFPSDHGTGPQQTAFQRQCIVHVPGAKVEDAFQ